MPLNNRFAVLVRSLSFEEYRNTTIWKSGLPKGPVITVTTVTSKVMPMVHHTRTAVSYAKKFSGKYAHRIIKGGVGHNLPQEAPHAFAKSCSRCRRLLNGISRVSIQSWLS
jgi:hypothetical protein